MKAVSARWAILSCCVLALTTASAAGEGRMFLLPAGVEPGSAPPGTYTMVVATETEVVFDVWIESTTPTLVRSWQVWFDCAADDSGATTGSVDFTAVEIFDESPDYIFFFATGITYPSTNQGDCPTADPAMEGPRAMDTPFEPEDYVTVTEAKYLSTWTFQVTPDAEGSFLLRPYCVYGDGCPADRTWVGAPDNSPIPLVMDPLEVVVTGEPCPCDADVYPPPGGNGYVDLDDILHTLNCAAGLAPPGECEQADVNCNGVVDTCDASSVQCAFLGGPDCCGADVVCGACCTEWQGLGPCEQASAELCELFLSGDYRGELPCRQANCDFPDCNLNGVPDDEDIATGTSEDCNENGIPDECDIAEGTSADVNENGIPDECEPPCVTDADCDDGDYCTEDLCIDGLCHHYPIPDCEGPPRMFLLPAGLDPGDTPPEPFTMVVASGMEITVDVWVESIQPTLVRAWQVWFDCAADDAGAMTGSIGFAAVELVDVRPDYIFFDRDTLPAVNQGECPTAYPDTEGPRALDTPYYPEDYPFVTTARYLSTWTFQVTTDAEGVFLLRPYCVYGDGCPNYRTWLAAEDATPMPFVMDPLEVVVTGEPCPCNADVYPPPEGDGEVTIVDVIHVIDCVAGLAPPAECEQADVNCDGVADICDASRVLCAAQGLQDCCGADTVCGACCTELLDFGPCVSASAAVCEMFFTGEYQGDGVQCWEANCFPDCNDNGVPDDEDIAMGTSQDCNENGIPDECDIADGTSQDVNENGIPDECEDVCQTDEDCEDGDLCTVDTCIDGFCIYEPVDCSYLDGVCSVGVCDPGSGECEISPINEGGVCDDGDICTYDDHCEGGFCVGTLIECNHDGVCDEPCENPQNCPDDCGACYATRGFSGSPWSYCPGTLKTVYIDLDIPPETLAAGVEDSPPPGWTEIYNISDSGTYDAENHKVKWGPFFPPFPGVLSYEVVAPIEAVGVQCFEGTISIDGLNNPICGECLEEFCCPYIPADELQEPCEGCADCTCATCADGRVEMCEMIGYACAWKSGCNDDLAGMTRAAYLWMSGECYCWDEAEMNWFPVSCSPPAPRCCEGRGADADGVPDLAPAEPAATVVLPVRPARSSGLSEPPHLKVPITIKAPKGTSAMALEIRVPAGWQVTVISDAGLWDELHRKIKWGPFFDNLSRTVTFKVRRTASHLQQGGFEGNVSFDGVNSPIAVK